MFGLGMGEMAIIGIIAVLLFGKRLPEVAKSVGKSYYEFTKSLREMQSSLNTAVDPYASSSDSYSTTGRDDDDAADDYDEATAPKFEPPTGEPADESESAV